MRNTGFIGSSCIQVFEWNAASTGLTAAQCQQEGIPYDTVYVLPKDRVGIMPGSTNLHYKLIYEVPTGKVLGAQAISKGDAPKRIDVAATLIKFGGTVDDLRDLELCYAPPFSAPKDAGNYAGLVAGNLLAHRFRQVHVDQVRQLVESGAYILDVRPPEMYNLGHLKTSVNIPLGQLRCRLLCHTGLGAQQIQGFPFLCQSVHQMAGEFNARRLLLQRRAQHGRALDDADAVRQHQIRAVHSRPGLRVLPADLHDLRVGGGHIVGPGAADQLHSPLHSLCHGHVVKADAQHVDAHGITSQHTHTV